MIRRPPRSTLFPTRRSSDLFDRREEDRDIVGFAQDGPERRGDVGGVQGGGRHLVEQRLEEMVVTPVEQRSEEHTSELQSRLHLVCRLLLEKKKNKHGRESVA